MVVVSAVVVVVVVVVVFVVVVIVVVVIVASERSRLQKTVLVTCGRWSKKRQRDEQKDAKG